MGGIDLDPASSAKANETVEAAQFYTEKENGLRTTVEGKRLAQSSRWWQRAFVH